METAQVAMLFKSIKRAYPMFDGSIDNVRFWARHLTHVPYELAESNLDRHIKRDRFPPTIADLLRPAEPEKDESAMYHEEMRRRGSQLVVEFDVLQKRFLAMSPEEHERIERSKQEVRKILAKRSYS